MNQLNQDELDRMGSISRENLEVYCETLEKALDKACELLRHWYEIPNGKYGNPYKTEEDWKEWALKDE